MLIESISSLQKIEFEKESNAVRIRATGVINGRTGSCNALITVTEEGYLALGPV